MKKGGRKAYRLPSEPSSSKHLHPFEPIGLAGSRQLGSSTLA